MSTIELIKKGMKENKLVIGYRSVARLLKKGKLSKVIMASNAPDHIAKEIENLANISGVESIKIDKDNLALGATCRRSFGVSVVGIKSSEEK